MQAHICWTGQLYNSEENCRLTATVSGIEVDAVINGVFEDKIFSVEYIIKTNQNWETLAFEIKSRIEDKSYYLSSESNGSGIWITNDKQEAEFNGCIDIDISLTPFTNTLPIKRLNLREDERRRIPVLYIDILEQQARRTDQVYTKISDKVYRYENTIDDFKALITVDDAGLVVVYPGLFTRNTPAE